jgi:hypothetical protein
MKRTIVATVVDVTVCKLFPHSIEYIACVARSVVEISRLMLLLGEFGLLQNLIGLGNCVAISLEIRLGITCLFADQGDD